MSAQVITDSSSGATARRIGALAVASLVAVVDLAVKAWAKQALPLYGVEAGPVDLRLAFNPGVAFGVAGAAPAGVVTVMTALITAGVAVLVWRAAGYGIGVQVVALASILGGAGANLTDRASDGLVTDYLHTGWWPTFNLADVVIVTGAGLALLAEMRRDITHHQPPVTLGRPTGEAE